MEKAVDLLREHGLAATAKKADRIAAEGLVYSYIHGNGRIGVRRSQLRNGLRRSDR